MIVILVVVASVMVNLRQEEEEITPIDRFFVTSLKGPQGIDIDQYRLRVEGLVGTPGNFTYSDVLSMPSLTERATLRCVTGGTSTGIWKGVRISEVLNLVGLEEGAREVVFLSADGFSTSLTLEDALKDDVMLAYELNNETLPDRLGYPLRVVSPNQYGYKWAMWVVSIEVVDYDYRGFWEQRGWDDGAYISLESDWWVHTIAFSCATVIGLFSVASGFENIRKGKVKGLRKYLTPELHTYTGYIFAGIMIPVFLYWSLQTLSFRGSLYYTLHGSLGLAVVVLLALSLLTGFYAKGERWKGVRVQHIILSTFTMVLLLLTISLGILLAIS